MSVKDLLVVVDLGRSAAERIDVALRMARDFGAHLTGLYVSSPAPLRPSMLEALPPEVLDLQARVEREGADKARALFEERVERVELGISTEWREAEGDVGEMAVLHARYADLTVIGQTDPDDDLAPGTARDLPQRLILGGGRPVLVVPYAGAFPTVGQRVMVAWNASREATRAVNDALPLLQKAARVTVLSVNPRVGPGGHGEVPGADIALHLVRHGVRAEVASVNTEDLRVDDMLLSQVADMGADLIVMGGYGHSRLGEMMLGGATRHLLRQITVPVLMSH